MVVLAVAMVARAAMVVRVAIVEQVAGPMDVRPRFGVVVSAMPRAMDVRQRGPEQALQHHQ